MPGNAQCNLSTVVVQFKNLVKRSKKFKKWLSSISWQWFELRSHSDFWILIERPLNVILTVADFFDFLHFNK